MTPPLGRRGFLDFAGRLGAGAGLGLLGLVGARSLRSSFAQASAAPVGQHPLRPPGALPEPAFRATCTRCYLCGQACSAGAIIFPDRVMGSPAPLPRHHGATGARRFGPSPIWESPGTPYVLPWITACNVCMRCGDACPNGALAPAPARDRATVKRFVRMGVARIDPKVCFPYTRVSWCGACFTACPYRGQAITVDSRSRPVIHPEHCIGCGLCVEVCPIRYKAVAVVPPFYPDSGRVRSE